MPTMDLFAMIGMAGKELFDYNREMYQFDQEQRLDRDLLRLEMQVKRFKLFREDIRDLVELTVGKMEMYHMVGALTLWFCITWYTEGRIRAPEAPPFILSLYWMSIAGSFVYLLLTVWLSMHASVHSHSIGVRLLTRYMRLPIPGAAQLNALNPRGQEFEHLGAKRVMRIPFLGGNPQEWLRRARGLPSVDESEAETAGGATRAGNQHYAPMVERHGRMVIQDLLRSGEAPDLSKKKSRMPGKHIQLFRRLQMKWQCYDAYARVCMSLGMNQVLMSACFYLICVTLLEYHSPSLCFALVLIFQSCSLAMSVLDISEVAIWKLCLHWLFGSLAPVLTAATQVTLARTEKAQDEAKGIDVFENKFYHFAMVPFFLIAGWMVGLLWLAWPSPDQQTLPRNFRAVLFIDVFAMEDDRQAPAGTARDGPHEPKASRSTIGGTSSMADPHLTQEQAAAADEACYLAEAGLRRWEAVPAGTSEASTQGAEVARLRRELTVWRKALNNEAARIAGTHGDMDAVSLLEVDTRTWNELSQEEQAQDPWAGCVLGPFEHNTLASYYYYDLEAKQFIWEVPEDRGVLALEELQAHVESAEDKVRAIFSNGREWPPERTGSGLSRGMSMRESEAGDGLDEDGCGDSFRDLGCCCCHRNKQGKAAFVPERLPWFSLSWMTWALVIAWIFEGSFVTYEEVMKQEYDKPQIGENDHHQVNEDDQEPDDFGVMPGAQQPRRLLAQLAAARWSFSPAEVSWPRGLFFRPEALACLPEPGGALLVGGSGALHWAPTPDASRPAPLQLTVLPTPSPPPGAVALCGAAGKAALSGPESAVPCLMGVPTADGVTFWRPERDDRGRGPSDAVTLPLRGRPWRRMAGAAVRCADFADLLQQEPDRPLPHGAEDAAWCLLLAGWDGERLPVAALRLPDGPAGAPPAASARIAPVFDAPLAVPGGASAGAREEVVSLHVEPQRGRLWALHSDGGLQAWDLRRPRSFGRWRPDWTPQPTAALGAGIPGAFRAVALCEDAPRGRLLVLGRHGTAGPQLLWSQLPEALAA